MNDQKVVELKAQIFDLLAQQEGLKLRFNEIEQQKQEKLKELQPLVQPQSQVTEEDSKSE